MSTAVTQVEVIIPTQTTYLGLIGSIGDHLVKELKDFSGDQEELAYQLNLVLKFYDFIKNCFGYFCCKNIKHDYQQ